MHRMLIALVMTVSAMVGALSSPAFADRRSQDRLDRGQTIASQWSSTERFGEFDARGRDDVRFTTGNAWQIRAEGDPRALAALRFFVDDGRLVIGRHSSDHGRDTGKATIHVTAPALRAVGAMGSGAVQVDKLSGDTVRASLAGSGNLGIGSVFTRTLTASVAGSGTMTLAGRSDDAEFSVAGSGDIAAHRFDAGSASASIAGSGDVSFRSDGEVAANIAGSGNVNVSGRANCKQSRVGSGRLLCPG